MIAVVCADVHVPVMSVLRAMQRLNEFVKDNPELCSWRGAGSSVNLRRTMMPSHFQIHQNGSWSVLSVQRLQGSPHPQNDHFYINYFHCVPLNL